jgi:hypothetical protein
MLLAAPAKNTASITEAVRRGLKYLSAKRRSLSYVKMVDADEGWAIIDALWSEEDCHAWEEKESEPRAAKAWRLLHGALFLAGGSCGGNHRCSGHASSAAQSDGEAIWARHRIPGGA